MSRHEQIYNYEPITQDLLVNIEVLDTEAWRRILSSNTVEHLYPDR